MDIRERSTSLDARVILLGFVLNVIAFPFFDQPIELLCFATLSFTFLLLEKHYRRAASLCVQFSAFYLLSLAGAAIVKQNPLSIAGMELTIVGIFGQRVVPVLGYVHILAHISSGEFMSVLMNLRLPKSVAIGIASLFRFIPALKQTFFAMRQASLFRGDGFRLKSILLHPARSLEYYLLPFLSRLSRVSDDLAAALSTRGVGLEGTATSVRNLRAKTQDYIVLSLLFCFYGALILWRYF